MMLLSRIKKVAERMLDYFRTAGKPGSEFEAEDIPSFVRFAGREGIFTEQLWQWQEENRSFKQAYRECERILADRIADHALHKKLDASVARMLLAASLGQGAEEEKPTFQLKITLCEPEKADEQDGGT